MQNLLQAAVDNLCVCVSSSVGFNMIVLEISFGFKKEQ